MEHTTEVREPADQTDYERQIGCGHDQQTSQLLWLDSGFGSIPKPQLVVDQQTVPEKHAFDSQIQILDLESITVSQDPPYVPSILPVVGPIHN